MDGPVKPYPWPPSESDRVYDLLAKAVTSFSHYLDRFFSLLLHDDQGNMTLEPSIGPRSIGPRLKAGLFMQSLA